MVDKVQEKFEDLQFVRKESQQNTLPIHVASPGGAAGHAAVI